MDQLGEVAALARRLVAADARVAEAERELRAAEEHARRLREESLPGAMQELGLTDLELDDGARISVGLEVYCAIPATERARAFEWLEEHDFGGLIKTEVKLPFGRGAEETAALQRLVLLLQQNDFDFEAKQDVHPQTLKAWLKEQLREGRSDLPLQLFGARPVTLAKVKLPKGKP
jgi:hypothetical protein